jgi:glutamate/tyrosine decarboxylase-like PLP-dependent enzyme
MDRETLNFVDFGLQNSRGFRALKVWLMLQQAGVGGYRRMITDDIMLARRLADLVAGREELELVTQHLSITTVLYFPVDLAQATAPDDTPAYLDRLNLAIVDRLQLDGRAFVANAVVDGRYVLRACVVSFHSTTSDIDALPDSLVASGVRVDAELRPRSGQ